MNRDEIKKIYFDMDGVLADFDRGVVELLGQKPLDQMTRDDASDDEMYAAMRAIPNYYDKLELMEGAKELFDAVYNEYGNRCEILSGIPKAKRGIVTAGEDKIKWMHRLLSDQIEINIVYSEEKQNYCFGPEYVLIDDYELNIEQWKAKGGTGIFHKNAADTLAQLRALNIV